MQSAARSLAAPLRRPPPRRALPVPVPLPRLSTASPQEDPCPDPGPGPSPDADPGLVSALSRVLSDFRGPLHDLPAALRGFAPRLTPDAAAAVLRRCRHLPVPSLRFFLFAAALPGFAHLPDSLLVLANSLAGARLFPLLRSLLSDLPPAALSRGLFPRLFRAYSRALLPDDAVRAFSSMAGFGFHPTLADFHSLLFALSHNGLVEHAETFFRESATSFDVSAKTYTILISGWAVVEKPESAQKLFDEMVERGVEPDVPAYNALIDALCRGGDIARAEEHLKDMQQSRGLVPDAATYGPFIRAACASKDARASLRVLDRMRTHDLTPNVFTYNAIIRLLCELGEIEEAYNILGEIIARGEKPDVWSYNTLLNTHCKKNEVNKALRVIARMDKGLCVPDRHSYNMLLKMLIGIGRIDKAVEIWDGMEERGFHPGAATYAVMIHGLSCKKGRLEEACSYFVMMVDEGIPPYQATCEVLRDRLTRHALRDQLEVITDRMRRSTSCTIQEMASVMCTSKKADETRSVSIEQELTGHALDESEWRGKWKLGD
ncbi:pentatricopeptide repeat-containing protein At1g52640, mitochondrial [Lolium rigidum]|uniref:pentatricopeptide repeat-containing protein At1g52640, mitochondrial n=1 Tax=Lolium rigidum TaxID=89674 RepID=UPI001F5E2B77|nr:pentatricopeptide repeat-containing protein At1g52640, mitochondrial [Lolium rigidum]